jgi:hypothetical protein
MSWYYAENNERRGPLDEAAFQQLVSSGAIKPETLVWQEGMANWLPFAQIGGGSGAVPAPAPTLGSATAEPGTVQCSNCGKFFPPGDVITIGGRNICATCKPLVVQQMVEGADAGGASIDPAKLLADVRARGGYRMDIGSLLSRAWALVKANLWPCIGTTWLAYFVMIVSQQIPCLGILAPFFVTGPMFGGLFLYFIKQLRGQPAVIGDAFTGFNKPHFGQLALAGTVQTLAAGLVAAVLIGPGLALNWSKLQSPGNELPIGFIIWCFFAILPAIYLTVCWILSYAFIIDKRLRFWDAMELSRKLVNMNLGGWVVFMIANFLLAMAGVLALCVGVIFVLPVLICVLMVIYEDIVSPQPLANA